MSAISAVDIIKQARCRAERRYMVNWSSAAGRGESEGNGTICGSMRMSVLLVTVALSEDAKEGG